MISNHLGGQSELGAALSKVNATPIGEQPRLIVIAFFVVAMMHAADILAGQRVSQ